MARSLPTIRPVPATAPCRMRRPSLERLSCSAILQRSCPVMTPGSSPRMASIELKLRMASSIGDVAAEEWDACANPVDGGDGPRPVAADLRSQDLFITHSFRTISCASLELSDSVRARTGWQPMHLLAEDSGGALVGAVPCYVKSHSRGEYVFDHGWAEAFERAGGSYYPKLQVSVPFTPATGRRLLARPGPHADAVRADARRRADRHLPALRCLLRARHLPDRAGMAVARQSAASSSAPTSSSTGRTRATVRSTTSWRRWPRASARPSAASARTRSRSASACIG